MSCGCHTVDVSVDQTALYEYKQLGPSSYVFDVITCVYVCVMLKFYIIFLIIIRHSLQPEVSLGHLSQHLGC